MEEPQLPEHHRPPPPAPEGVVDPKITKSLIANYEALENDLQQATEMAMEYQRQLAGKSNELAHLNQLFTRTQQHLQSLELGIEELRTERHRLANEAMRAAALEIKLDCAIKENQMLRSTINSIQCERRSLAQEQAKRELERAKQDQEREALIKRLTQDSENRRWIG